MKGRILFFIRYHSELVLSYVDLYNAWLAVRDCIRWEQK